MDLTIHVIHSFDPERANPVLDKILARLGDIMADLKDVNAKVTQEGADVAALATTVGQAITLLDGLVASNADLRKQLADALAGGLDPAAVQAILDQMDANHTSASASIKALSDKLVADQPTA